MTRIRVFLAAVTFVAIGVAGCTGPPGPPGQDGADGQPGPDADLRTFMFGSPVDIPPNRTGDMAYVEWLEDHIVILAQRVCDLENAMAGFHGTAACPDPFPDPPPPWPPE